MTQKKPIKILTGYKTYMREINAKKIYLKMKIYHEQKCIAKITYSNLLCICVNNNKMG